MAIKTTLELLENVQAAIAEAEASQELRSKGGEGVVRGRLDMLYERESNLLARYNREQAGSKYAGPACVHGVRSGR